MKTKNIIYLITLIVSSISCVNKPSDNNASVGLASKDLLELIRTGYDLVNEDSFSEICQRLNDSILNRPFLEIQVVSEINLIDSTINWSLWYMDRDRPTVRDELLLNIDIDKGAKLNIQNATVQTSDIQDLTRNYIFYPDSSTWEITQTKRYVDSIGEIETSMVFAMLNVNIKKNDGFTTNDWKSFFAVLTELIKLCEDERNRMSLKLWEKDYHSLPFNQKHTVTDIVGYHIMITFL